MKPSAFLLFILILLTGCSSKGKKIAETNRAENDSIIELYIYHDKLSDTSTQPDDSLKIYRSSFEKSLELYKNIDALEKEVENQVYISIFKLLDKKFSIIIDSTAIKVFEFTNGHYKKIQNIDSEIGINGINLQKIDINSDGFNDILIEIPSGGFFGSAYTCLFYNSVSKSLVCDRNIELRNIELNLKKKLLTSNLSMTSETYYIDNYKFKLIEKKVNLGKTTGIEKLENTFEISKYDLMGNLIRKDTLVQE